MIDAMQSFYQNLAPFRTEISLIKRSTNLYLLSHMYATFLIILQLHFNLFCVFLLTMDLSMIVLDETYLPMIAQVAQEQ